MHFGDMETSAYAVLSVQAGRFGGQTDMPLVFGTPDTGEKTLRILWGWNGIGRECEMRFCDRPNAPSLISRHPGREKKRVT